MSPNIKFYVFYYFFRHRKCATSCTACIIVQLFMRIAFNFFPVIFQLRMYSVSQKTGPLRLI